MTVVSVAEVRSHLSEIIASTLHDDVVIERRGKRAAVLVSPEHYERMMEALEDAADVAAFDSAMAEEGPNVPWDEVKADLGWQ
ncbi:prevent-host-death family protein [Curtobacterium sp. MCBD17_013]|uniref:type II toxin-antitoxin system Phd/YefM family antitoxin n=1 Tax=unclassified Curtobacterium TaxID=257496 RepID=UPI000DA7C40A|nr:MULTISPECIES: type II toxin-antitoxin system Phd/YefM family antitoxin [unclassified Curtobacterium]PZE77921.1 prevent-host-death family protein [Curtobacterium sp. MCBD17_019]PZF56919.1 prevent-host-death family protein [Curtobacterium sp. MCBD17_013]WIB63525.1 type II toxin-antitoxin system Phd/YefM family antitoxin [Curtobacterium sp. MCBD17_040]WIB67363.1 type II toxin-antitoxin system Phd/YefM family antitoxin [Curtobacterium sp. MCBD17_035]WIE54558.1 type II toxin-antitoxin system Phd